VAQDSVLPDPEEMKRVEAAIDRGLEYLLRHQNADGSFQSWNGRNHAVNGPALLAFLGRGHVPGRGPYQPVVDRAVAFIQATQTPQGLYRSPNAARTMYEQGLVTLAMIEASGNIGSPALRDSVQRAVDLIVSAQNPQGGWRYNPTSTDADLSVTVMQVVALRAAQNARLRVPQETIDLARQYVLSCAHPNGGFGYQPGGGPAPARTAAGTLSLQLLGGFDHPAVEAGLKYLQNMKYGPHIAYFYYCNYYAMQAAFQAGGDHWEHWHPVARKWFLDHQHPDGSWPGIGSEAKFNHANALTFSTAFATICLEVYLHYLPAYQR
jgi:prenyltransferase beta subunit